MASSAFTLALPSLGSSPSPFNGRAHVGLPPVLKARKTPIVSSSKLHSTLKKHEVVDSERGDAGIPPFWLTLVGKQRTDVFNSKLGDAGLPPMWVEVFGSERGDAGIPPFWLTLIGKHAGQIVDSTSVNT
nr:TPA: Linusorb D1 precursor protein G4-136N [Linum usitatissimum]